MKLLIYTLFIHNVTNKIFLAEAGAPRALCVQCLLQWVAGPLGSQV